MENKVEKGAIIRTLMAGAGVAAVLAGSISCGDVVGRGRAPVLMVVDSLEAASGAEPEEMSGFLLSDVQTLVEQNAGGETVRVPNIFDDVAQATLRLVNKDQGTAGLGTTPSTLNAVTLNRYRIVYRRADGRNTAGTDVPFGFDGAVTATLTHSPSTILFEIVRHQAKLESPLKALAGFGGRIFISTIAEVTFYGKDLVGNDVQATATISVSFADYADPN